MNMNREWLALLNPRQKGRGWVRGRGHHPQQHLKEEKQDPATHQMSGQKEKAPGIPVRGQTSVGRAMEVRKQTEGKCRGYRGNRGKVQQVWEVAAQGGYSGHRKEEQSGSHLQGPRASIPRAQVTCPGEHTHAWDPGECVQRCLQQKKPSMDPYYLAKG